MLQRYFKRTVYHLLSGRDEHARNWPAAHFKLTGRAGRCPPLQHRSMKGVRTRTGEWPGLSGSPQPPTRIRNRRPRPAFPCLPSLGEGARLRSWWRRGCSPSALASCQVGLRSAAQVARKDSQPPVSGGLGPVTSPISRRCCRRHFTSVLRRQAPLGLKRCARRPIAVIGGPVMHRACVCVSLARSLSPLSIYKHGAKKTQNQKTQERDAPPLLAGREELAPSEWFRPPRV